MMPPTNNNKLTSGQRTLTRACILGGLHWENSSRPLGTVLSGVWGNPDVIPSQVPLAVGDLDPV